MALMTVQTRAATVEADNKICAALSQMKINTKGA